MTKEEKLKALRVKLYKATPLKLQLAAELKEKITNSFKGNFKGIEVTSITFKENSLKLGGISVKTVEIDPREIGCILIH